MADWDDDAHPRDERGRFAGGAGGPGDLKAWAKAGGERGSTGGPGDLKAWAKANAPRGANVALAREAANRRVWVGKTNDMGKTWTGQLVGKTPETWQEHYSAHPDKGGKANPERAAFHEKEIIAPAFAGKKTASELGEKPKAILTMGGPASGKGVVLSKLGESRDLSHFVHVDPDEVKAKLPEYKASVPKNPNDGPTFLGAANQVHEESSAVAKQIRDRAIEKGHHIIVDGTGGNADNFKALMKRLEDRGYDVEVHHAQLHADEGVKRAAGRAERSGRSVPEHFIRDTYSKIASATPDIRAAAPLMHTYDASKKGHPLVTTHRRGTQA